MASDFIEILRDIRGSQLTTELARDDETCIYGEIAKMYDILTGDNINYEIVANNIATINGIYSDLDVLNSLYADKATLDSIFADKSKLDSIFADKATLDSLYADKATLDSIFADKTALDSIAANMASILDATSEPLRQSILDAESNADTASSKATEAQLKAWEAEAERMTADSFATEPEDVFVKIWSSNGDGTFSSVNTTEYSSYHWKEKSSLAASGDASNINYSNISSGMTASNVQTALDEIDTKLDGIENGATADQNANEVPYDNTDSGLVATNVKTALDELDSDITNKVFNQQVASSTNTNPDSITVSNTVLTNGFSAFLHTGNGGTQNILNGIDFVTAAPSVMALPLWVAGTYNTGDEVTIVREGRTIRVVCLQDGVTSDPNLLFTALETTATTHDYIYSDWQIDSQTNGGLAWVKGRSVVQNHRLVDTLRGQQRSIYSSLTNSEENQVGDIVNFNSTGFTVGSIGETNTNLATYVSWSYQTTHIKSLLTSHGKPQIEEYNPVTGFGIIKYKGSGLAGHEISQSQGRELGMWVHKSLSIVGNWMTYTYINDNRLHLDLDNAESVDEYNSRSNSSTINILDLAGSDSAWNTNSELYITYYFANAIETEEGLQGNFEVLEYSGVPIGTKIRTKGKPLKIDIKRIDETGNWTSRDILRYGANSILDDYLFLNLPNAEEVDNTLRFGIKIIEDGFIHLGNHVDENAIGGRYLAFIVYDNDSGSGKSKYPKASDTSYITATNSHFNYTNDRGVKGYNTYSQTKNKSILHFANTVEGIKWVSMNDDDTESVFDLKPSYGLYEKQFAEDNRPVIDVDTGKVYSTTGGELVVNGTFDTDISGWNSIGSDLVDNSNVTNGVVTLTRSGSNSEHIEQSFQTVLGEKYAFSVDCMSISGGGFSVYISTSTGSSDIFSNELDTSSFKTIEHTFIGTGSTVYISLKGGNLDAVSKFDNISVFKKEPTVGSEILPTPSFMQNPVYFENGVPVYIDYSQELEVNYMDSLNVKKLTTQENRKIIEIGTIFNNSRYVIDWQDVFPDYEGDYESYDVRVEIYVNNIWSESGSFTGGASNYMTNAVSNEEGVVIQTGFAGLIYNIPSYGGSGFPSNTGSLTSAPARIIVTYHGRAKNV